MIDLKLFLCKLNITKKYNSSKLVAKICCQQFVDNNCFPNCLQKQKKGPFF